MRKIFIDGGAHKGEAIEVLIDKRPDMFGCEVYFYEPNIDLIPFLEKMSQENKNYNIKVFNCALWDTDGEINFLESIERWSTLASTVVPTMNEIWGLKLDRENPKKVTSKSLSNILKTFNDEDYLVVKLDIEGSEYYVIEDLFTTKQIEKIDELYIEWHDHFFPHLKENGDELRNKLRKLELENKIKVRNDWM
jgi:FkbM family methyltransferase